MPKNTLLIYYIFADGDIQLKAQEKTAHPLVWGYVFKVLVKNKKVKYKLYLQKKAVWYG